MCRGKRPSVVEHCSDWGYTSYKICNASLLGEDRSTNLCIGSHPVEKLEKIGGGIEKKSDRKKGKNGAKRGKTGRGEVPSEQKVRTASGYTVKSCVTISKLGLSLLTHQWRGRVPRLQALAAWSVGRTSGHRLGVE
jgi:hypothetical protein